MGSIWLGRVWLRLALAVCSAVSLGGCGGSDPALEALTRDPMAAYAPDGTKLISDSEREARMAMGKPYDATILRTFALGPGLDGERLVKETREFAATHGWQEFRGGKDGFTAYGKVGGYEASRVVYLFASGDDPSYSAPRDGLGISLTAVGSAVG